jgi:hypothetical protein
MRMRTIWLVVALACAPSARVAAQQSVTDALTFLVTNQSVNTGNFEQDRAAAQATSDTISRALLANLATLPVNTSSSGFVYRLSPSLGTVTRVTQSFGPFFVERALTAGAGQASVGLTVQQMYFTSLGDHDLRAGSLVTTANQFVDERAPFDVDQLTLKIDATVATLYANLGISDRLEVGLATPMIALRVDGSRVNTYFGRTLTQARASATSVGLADMVVRGKVNLYSGNSIALATAADVRLPTGRRQDLLGAGSMSVRVAGIASVESGRWSTHANGGISLGGLAREFNYGGAVAVAATGRVTVTGELVGRRLDGPGGFSAVSAPNANIVGVETIRLVPDASTLTMITAMPGVKWNVSDTWVLAANVSVPLRKAGLTAPFIPFIGLDYAFGR